MTDTFGKLRTFAALARSIDAEPAKAAVSTQARRQSTSFDGVMAESLTIEIGASSYLLLKCKTHFTTYCRGSRKIFQCDVGELTIRSTQRIMPVMAQFRLCIITFVPRTFDIG
jgi:hypothetical protein